MPPAAVPLVRLLRPRPLLLVLNSEPWARPRFRFDQYWTKIDDFLAVVRTALGSLLG
jgi:hypothetical protein